MSLGSFIKLSKKYVLSVTMLGESEALYATTDLTLGGMASTMTGSFTQVSKLITAGSYLARLAFSIGAIMKFKQHKDKPKQIPIGTPVVLVFIDASLLFLTTILSLMGYTMFGSAGSTADPTGTVFTTGS